MSLLKIIIVLGRLLAVAYIIYALSTLATYNREDATCPKSIEHYTIACLAGAATYVFLGVFDFKYGSGNMGGGGGSNPVAAGGAIAEFIIKFCGCKGLYFVKIKHKNLIVQTIV